MSSTAPPACAGTILGPISRRPVGAVAALVSYRLGGDDGVSVEARKWAAALRDLGFRVRRVAGELEDGAGPDDVLVPGLTITEGAAPDEAVLARALGGADLVVVENICSLPLNLAAARATAAAVAARTGLGGRTLFHHHDLPWQRRHLVGLEREFPPRCENTLHVTVNMRSRRELEARGYRHVHAIHNRFDLRPRRGDRTATRAAFGFGDDDVVLFQPSRAIERKNVAGGLRYAQRVAALLGGRPVRYWLSGPAEDGYEPVLEKLRAAAPLPFTLGRAASAADAYAACDAVVFPSTWEGFGNPTIESIAHRRACAAFPYPVLAEILASGIRLFTTETPETLVRFWAEPPEVRDRYFDVNLHRAQLSFDLADLPKAVDAILHDRGWTKW